LRNILVIKLSINPYRHPKTRSVRPCGCLGADTGRCTESWRRPAAAEAAAAGKRDAAVSVSLAHQGMLSGGPGHTQRRMQLRGVRPLDGETPSVIFLSIKELHHVIAEQSQH